MPTEHEFKFVMSLDLEESAYLSLEDSAYERDPEAFYPKLLWPVSKKDIITCFIKQGYLAFSKGMTTRIREIEKWTTYKESTRNWFLTFKQKVGGRVIEIEKKLDERDGADLWEVCVGKLKKTRLTVDYNSNKWEIDFFKNSTGETYFILVEIELEEGASRPELPDFLRKYLLYEVPLTDDTFSNKRLGDIERTKKLYQELQEGGLR